MSNSLFVMDGSNYFWRAFHSPGGNLSCSCYACKDDIDARDGCSTCLGTGQEPTKATYTVLKQVAKIANDYKPGYLAVVFDGPRTGLRRREIYPAYKGDRENHEVKYPKAAPQFRRICQILKALGVCLIECKGYEADDAMAALALQAARQNIPAAILSRDNDMLQACSMSRLIRVLDPLTGQWYTKESAGKKWGLRTRQIPDLLAMVGGHDNIPGIKGVGEKTAASLLIRHGGLPEILKAAKGGLLPKALAGKILAAKADGSLDISLRLGALDTEIDLDFATLPLKFNKLNVRAAAPLLARVQIRNLH